MFCVHRNRNVEHCCKQPFTWTQHPPNLLNSFHHLHSVVTAPESRMQAEGSGDIDKGIQYEGLGTYPSSPSHSFNSAHTRCKALD